MSYTQKYCLVSFIKPIDIGTGFSMEDWPLHVTLADVFAIDRDATKIESKLARLLSGQLFVETRAKAEATLGTAKVVLLNKTDELINLHKSLVDLLEKNGTVFNSPEFTREGFLPHCTVQKTERINTDEKIIINVIALVDMYPEGNWQQRKVVSTFKLQSEHTE